MTVPPSGKSDLGKLDLSKPTLSNPQSVRQRKPAGPSFRQLAFAVIERIMLIYAIMVFCGVTTFGRDPVAGNPESNPVTFYSNILILGFFGLLVVVNLKKSVEFLPFSYLLLAFLGLVLLSALWSIEPGITVRKFATLMTTALVVLYVSMRYDFATGLTIFGHAVLLVVLLSIVVVMVRPDLGITQRETGDALAGTWKGLLSAKNSLGWMAIVGAQVYGWRFIVEPKKRRWHALALVPFLLIMVKSGSATAVVGVALSLILLVLVQARRWQSHRRVVFEWGLIGLAVLVIAVFALDPAGILGLLGKDVSLTGRVPLWASLLHPIAERPLLGYGYGAFWLLTNPEVQRIWQLNPWLPPDAHNAFFGITLELGLVGLLLATLTVGVATARALAMCKRPDAPWAIFAATYLVVYLITNLDETAFFRGNDIHCALVIFCYFTALRATLAAKREALAAARAGVNRAPARMTEERPVEAGLRFRSINGRR